MQQHGRVEKEAIREILVAIQEKWAEKLHAEEQLLSSGEFSEFPQLGSFGNVEEIDLVDSSETLAETTILHRFTREPIDERCVTPVEDRSLNNDSMAETVIVSSSVRPLSSEPVKPVQLPESKDDSSVTMSSPKVSTSPEVTERSGSSENMDILLKETRILDRFIGSSLRTVSNVPEKTAADENFDETVILNSVEKPLSVSQPQRRVSGEDEDALAKTYILNPVCKLPEGSENLQPIRRESHNEEKNSLLETVIVRSDQEEKRRT